MSEKASAFDAMMRRVAACDLCCNAVHGIAPAKLLVNLIAEKPTAPRYGEVPTMFSDWTSRLDARLAMVLQDWGSIGAASSLRQHYENLTTASIFPMSREAAWRETVQHRPESLQSPSHRRLVRYLEESAELEGLRLPRAFCDDIFFTNAVLCFRRGEESGNGNIDLNGSIRRCCGQKGFLGEQLRIVNPKVVVAVGGWALRGLGIDDGIESVIRRTHERNPDGFCQVMRGGLTLNVVAVLHPTAHPKKGQKDFHEKQVGDYRCIWKALTRITGLAGEALVAACFSHGDPPR
jgi:hypothetical protein